MSTGKHRRERASVFRFIKNNKILIAFVSSLLIVAVAGFSIVTPQLRDVFRQAKVPTIAAPSLEELNESIELSQAYLDGLLKPVNEGLVQSETYTFPLKVHFKVEDVWVLLGQSAPEHCEIKQCTSITEIRDMQEDYTKESYELTFRNPLVQGDEFVAQIETDWAAGTITIAPKSVYSYIDLWLDNTMLGEFESGANSPLTVEFDKNDRSLMRSFRYTVRHATQEAFMYWSVRDPEIAKRFANFLRTNGFEPGYDLRATIFGYWENFPDNLPFDDKSYQDCEADLYQDTNTYPYESKVCVLMRPYLLASEADPLLQATQALHTLQKYGPKGKLPDEEWLQGTTPLEVSEHLQKQWGRTGYGVPKCTPINCSEPQVSGIRTSIFGSLETVHGYSYDDPIAKKYADAAAHMTIKSQIGSNGVINTKNGPMYRPASAGAYASAWDNSDGRFVKPDASAIGGIVLLTIGELAMPAEYGGLQPSNSETTFDGWAFLVRYRCAVYAVGCDMVPN